ncbi:hypothetical protein SEPCBS119000_003825 [Sporothrix epigloea]|uniref:C6 zinc finger domain containing protein n=1 Tax=Sporothrix epigloea TaxID=1892477 RepID=A0ABP0DNS2_9PEZI
MADRLKLDVKDRAASRREKRSLKDIEKGAASISLAEGARRALLGRWGQSRAGAAIFSANSSSTTRASTDRTEQQSSASPSATSFSRAGTTSTSPNTSTDECMSTSGRAQTEENDVLPPSSTSTAAAATTAPSSSATSWTMYDKPEASLAPPSLDRERELSLMMVYLDYVFPFLYPFCRPTVLSSGRGWLLVLLMKNKAVFHSALSLSSYFLAVVAVTTASLHSATPHGSDGTGAGVGAGPPPVPSVSAVVSSSGGNNDHSDCLSAVAAELHKQQELSLRELQRTIAGISRSQSDMPPSRRTEHLAESARALESILHLLSFEVVLQRFDSWQVHLGAALVLFEQMLQQSGEDAPPGKGAWEHLMDRLSPFDRAALDVQRVPSLMPHGSDQAALQFYASLLFYMDIVTSTITETAPRLQRYHRFLLAPNAGAPDSSEAGETSTHGHFQGPWALPDPSVAVYLHPQDVVGIHSWVLLVLADTVALAAWKKEAIAARRLSVAELMSRAAPIEQRLRQHLAALERNMQREFAAGHVGPQQDPLPSFSLRAGFYSRHLATSQARAGELGHGRHTPPHGQHGNDGSEPPSLPAPAHADGAAHLSVDTASHVWGCGVLAYLLVVVNGWQPEADVVRQAADHTLAALAALPSASCLRVAAWPLCVAGCLATTPQQRALYPGMVSEICGGELFGTVNEALRIMQAVWAAQDREKQARGGGGLVRSTEWSFAECFNILGRRAFLL